MKWWNQSWNCTVGCTPVSPACDNCYAERISLDKRFTKKPWTKPNEVENVQLKPHKLNDPRKIKEPSRIFVNSMSDLFHSLVPDDYIRQVFKVMQECPQHTFQILTKRPERAVEWPGPWLSNIWMGTSVENRKTTSRIDIISKCPARVVFLSCEPLLESLGDIDLTGIDWVIVGGESGPGYRPMDHAWAREIRDLCAIRNIPFFFKQSSAGRTEVGTQLIESDGAKTTIQEYPKLEPRQPAVQIAMFR